MNLKKIPLVACFLAMVSLLGGCTSIQKSSPVSPTVETDLTSEWEIQDEGIVYTIKLDRYGNGGYDWQKGRIETTSFVDGKWTGNWIQPGNDREGGFELRLSDDRSEAEGMWWYTRIGEKVFAPGESGGKFKLKRVPTDGAARTSSY